MNEEKLSSRINDLKKQMEELTEMPIGCGVCGGNLVLIRARYPGDDKRKVCPTCLAERLDDINKLSDPSHGKVYTDKEK